MAKSSVVVKKSLLILGIVVGSILALGPLWSMLGSMVGMSRAFDVLGSAGISDPRVLSSRIGEVLLATAAGFVACPIGVVLLVLCIVFLNKHNRAQPPPLPAVQPD